MTHTFDDPSTIVPIDYNDLQGALLMFEVLYFEEDFRTKFSVAGEKSPAVRANMTVIDGRQAGKVYVDAFVFPKVLVGQLRSRVGRTVLGRLGKGEAKAGMNPPWSLDPATPQDRQRAEQFLSGGGSPAPGQSTPQQSQAPF